MFYLSPCVLENCSNLDFRNCASKALILSKSSTCLIQLDKVVNALVSESLFFHEVLSLVGTVKDFELLSENFINRFNRPRKECNNPRS